MFDSFPIFNDLHHVEEVPTPPNFIERRECPTTNDFSGQLGLRISAVPVVFFASLVGVMFPLVSSRVKKLNLHPLIYFTAKYFGFGVVIGTAFVHLLYEAHISLSNPCLSKAFQDFPYAFGITLAGIFGTFLIELLTKYSIRKNNGGKDIPHTHGIPGMSLSRKSHDHHHDHHHHNHNQDNNLQSHTTTIDPPDLERSNNSTQNKSTINTSTTESQDKSTTTAFSSYVESPTFDPNEDLHHRHSRRSTPQQSWGNGESITNPPPSNQLNIENNKTSSSEFEKNSTIIQTIDISTNTREILNDLETQSDNTATANHENRVNNHLTFSSSSNQHSNSHLHNRTNNIELLTRSTSNASHILGANTEALSTSLSQDDKNNNRPIALLSSSPSPSPSPSSLSSPSKPKSREEEEEEEIVKLQHALSLQREARLTTQVANICLLEFGIVFHSIFVGLTLAVSGSSFPTLYVVICFHQLFEGMGLGSRLAETPWNKRHEWVPWFFAIAFAVTTPLGIAIGLGVRNSYPPNSARALITNGVFDAIAAGILIYASLIELMGNEFLHSEEFDDASLTTILSAYGIMALGCGAMSMLGRWA